MVIVPNDSEHADHPALSNTTSQQDSEQAALVRRQQWRDSYRRHRVQRAAKQRERYKTNPAPDRLASKQWIANDRERRRQQQHVEMKPLATAFSCLEPRRQCQT
jgi:hypothetical protein